MDEAVAIADRGALCPGCLAEIQRSIARMD
jgi:hypothetical protein